MLIESDAPLVHIDRTKRIAVTLDQVSAACSLLGGMTLQEDPVELLCTMCDTLRTHCELQGSHEHLFLMLYFDQLREVFRPDPLAGSQPAVTEAQLRRALMPLPKAHFYLGDSSSAPPEECTDKCVVVDFVFWTGRRFIAILIRDQGGPKQTAASTERRLQLWGMKTFMVTADHIENRGLEDLWPSFREVLNTDGIPKASAGRDVTRRGSAAGR
jgi:hypothetical protein